MLYLELLRIAFLPFAQMWAPFPVTTETNLLYVRIFPQPTKEVDVSAESSNGCLHDKAPPSKGLS
jgi:hypothetical protein